MLVDVFTPGDPQPLRQVVTLGTLRGPYEPIAAQVQAAADRLERDRQQRRDDYQRSRAVQNYVVDRALAAGFDADCAPGTTDAVTLPVGQLARLLDVFDRSQLRISA